MHLLTLPLRRLCEIAGLSGFNLTVVSLYDRKYQSLAVDFAALLSWVQVLVQSDSVSAGQT